MAPLLRGRAVAYWGDLDTWGLHTLASARSHLPHLQAPLMDRTTSKPTSIWPTEPVHACAPTRLALQPDEALLDSYLRAPEKGRLEQVILLPDRCIMPCAPGSQQVLRLVPLRERRRPTTYPPVQPSTHAATCVATDAKQGC